jgi:hypothetical protein
MPVRELDSELCNLSRFPNLAALIKDFGGLKRRKEETHGKWAIGQGYQPYHGSDSASSSSYYMSKFVGQLPDLPIEAFCRLAQPVDGL